MTRILIGIFMMALLAGRGLAADVLPLLHVGADTFTNVVVQTVTDTHIFFKHAGGEGSAKLSQLEPALQKQFGYNPAAPVQIASTAPIPVSTASSSKAAVESQAESSKRAIPFGMTTKDFHLADGRILRLAIPKVWTYSTRETPPDTHYTYIIRLEHPYENGFFVLITLMPMNNRFSSMTTEEAIAIPGHEEAKRSLEKVAAFEAMKGEEAKGHYYTLTRKDPSGRLIAGSQGMVKFGDQWVNFYIQSSVSSGKSAEAALEMIRTAHLLPKP